MLCLQTQGQTYYNFIMGYTPLTPNTSSSIVRAVDAQRAVAYYEDGGIPKLAVIDMYGHIAEVTLKNDVDIKDIRIVGDENFFCGQKRDTRNGIIGHTSVSEIEGCAVSSIPYRELDMDITPTSTIMWRLAAYTDGIGRYKVVSIGEMYYFSSSVNVPMWFYPCTSANYGSCHTFFAIEYDYVMDFSLVGFIFLCDSNHYERADDVVVTDNWLGIVSCYPDKSELIIHRCNKSNVIATFDNYYSYVVPEMEGIYHCCKMKGDSIALVALHKPGASPNYETHLRTVDLASMAMTSAQGYSLLDKAEPEEMVYLPEYSKLVLLQYQRFPSTLYHYAFVCWEPYTSPPYSAVTIYEKDDYPFYSLDRLTSKHIVAAGGNYWIEMDVPNYNPASLCHWRAFQQILQLSMPSYNTSNYTYHTLSLSYNRWDAYSSCSSFVIYMGCRFN